MAYTSTLVTSRITHEEHRFTWEIPSFGKIRDCARAVNLQKFQFEMGSSIGLPSKWKFYLTTHSDNGRGWIDCCLALDEKPDKTVTELWVILSVKIKNESYYHFIGRTPGEMTDMLQHSSVGFESLIPMGAYQYDNTVYLDLKQDLCFEIKVVLFNLNAVVPPEMTSCLANLESLYEHKFTAAQEVVMTNLIANSESYSAADMMVKMVSSDGKEFTVSREILAARSPVFLSMFQTPMLEMTKGVVKVDDISGAALEAILVYMHAGTPPGNWTNSEVIIEFTYAAHKYMLELLVEFLDNALGLVCTPENCGKLLALAKKLEMKRAEKDLTQVFKDLFQQSSLEEMTRMFQDLCLNSD